MAAFIQKTAAMGNSILGTVSKNGYYYSLEKVWVVKENLSVSNFYSESKKTGIERKLQSHFDTV
jgi:hypothetical protein